MVIYLKHPVHGQKVANMQLEAEADEANGWVRFDPYEQTEPAPVLMAAVEDEPRPEYELALSPPPEPRRLGRPRKTH